MAALTVPNAQRVDQTRRKSIPEIEAALAVTARAWSARIRGHQQTGPSAPINSKAATMAKI